MQDLESKLQEKFGAPSQVSSTEPQTDTLESKLAAKFGQPKLAEIEPSTNDRVSESPLMTTVKAFNHSVEEKTIGLWKRLGSVVDDSFGTKTQGAIDEYMARKEGELQGIRKINPVAAAVGDGLATLGLVAATLPLPIGNKITSAMKISGAIGTALGTTSYSSEENNGGVKSVLTGTAAGTAGGALGYGIGQGLSKAGELLVNTVKGAKLLLKTPDDLIDNAIAATAGKNAKATPEMAEKALNLHIADMSKQKDQLYKTRDAIAETQNIKVNFNELKIALGNADKDFLDNKVTAPTQAFLNKISSEYGDEVPFALAQKLMSKLGKIKNDFFVKGEGSIGNDMDSLYKAALRDIDSAATLSPELTAAQNVANTFYRDSYKPLKDTATKLKLQEGFTNEKFINAFLNKTSVDKSTANSFGNLPNDLKDQLVVAHINALKTVKETADGEFNPLTFASALRKQVETIPMLSKTAIDVENIAKIASAAGTAQKGNPLNSQLTRGFIGAGLIADGMGMGGSATLGATGFAVASKIPFLTAAGKMLSNPDSASLVTQMRNIDKMAAPLQQALMTKVGSIYASAAASSISTPTEKNKK
jgi:hypothetical protein